MPPATPASAPLDFEALLSRQYRPARVTHLVPQEAVRRNKDSSKEHNKPSSQPDEAVNKKKKLSSRESNEDEVLRLAMELVSHTPAYIRHVNKPLSLESSSRAMHDPIPKAPTNEWMTLPPCLHEVELGDWEKGIRWEGYVEGDNSQKKTDAASLLQERRNPHLDALVFDSTNVCWDGSKEDALEKARNVPLILDIGTTGQSVARQLLPSARPMSFGQSEAYMQRCEREWSTPATSTANVSGSLHANRDQLEKIIEQKQKKRTELAKLKRDRVTEAMGTLALGGGKGRTITSSLMGPGGTERTGRPSRHVGSSSSHVEYLEQLELVSNHMLVKPDLRKVELRQYHRPKLPRAVVRVDLPWQFQVRIMPSATKKTDQNANSSSYQSMMMGSHAGALSQSSIRNEADLSPTEGQLVLLEYSEERPPIQLTKGMGSKIVNFYRGDKTRCPVSAGGGDRPTRRKQHGDAAAANNNKALIAKEVERPPRLVGPNRKTSVLDWIGKPPKKAREDRSEKKSSVEVLPEGVTEILHPKAHGPFIGEVEEGITQTGLINNLFSVPMFRHEPESTDFLMILGQKSNKVSMGVVLRTMPSSVFCAGQTEPRTKVYAPNTAGERNFIVPFICYQIAKVLTRTEEKDGRGLRFDEINDGLFANTSLPSNALRQRIKQVAIYDKNTQIWTTKDIGVDDYPGVEALGRKFSPEGVAAYETECAAVRRLCDIGIHDLYSGAASVSSVGMAMVYLTGQVNAARERKYKMSKMLEFAKTSKNNSKTIVALYEEAASLLEAAWKEMRRKHEIARFIHEELQLAPWHLTSEFIEVHKNAQGSAMMKLTGLGDPSGLGEGYNFLREVDTKPNKGSGNKDGALSAQIKKITGTENDLRKLTMKQMASLLRSYGMKDKEINTLKRWDRVHVIRDLSTKAASDGMGDGLERFARGEKMKLSEQKQMYQDRIQEIWRRQRAALSTDATDSRPAIQGGPGGAASILDGDTSVTANTASEQAKQADKETEDSDSDFDDDDLAAEIEENMMDVQQTNQLVAAHVRGAAGEGGDMTVGGLGQQRREDAQELSKDARELAALKRQQEEERVARAGLLSGKAGPSAGMPFADSKLSMLGRKVVRRRVTKTHPDGRQTTSFKFVCVAKEVDKIVTRKKKEVEGGYRDDRSKKKGSKHGLSHHHRHDDRRTVGHAVFEDEDDVDRGRTSIKLQVQKRQVVRKSSGLHMARAPPKSNRPKTMLGKLKQRDSHEKRIQKRKRADEEADLYTTASKRMGTSNRRERGAARDRMPHVILADTLEKIRAAVEKRSDSVAFHRQVNRRQLPRYYEVISNPIALENIRDKNQRYEYRTADLFLRDFGLMRDNAVKFNGKESPLARSACAIYDFAKEQVQQSRAELSEMEAAVQDQLSGKKKKKKKSKAKSKALGSAAAGLAESNSTTMVDGVAVNLGDLGDLSRLGEGDSDSDDSGDYASFLNL